MSCPRIDKSAAIAWQEMLDDPNGAYVLGDDQVRTLFFMSRAEYKRARPQQVLLDGPGKAFQGANTAYERIPYLFHVESVAALLGEEVSVPPMLRRSLARPK
jgi:hypothetical protein